jgi:four helix bundle protein
MIRNYRDLRVWQASLAEVETQLEIAQRLSYCTREEQAAHLEDCSSLGKQLYALRNALH